MAPVAPRKWPPQTTPLTAAGSQACLLVAPSRLADASSPLHLRARVRAVALPAVAALQMTTSRWHHAQLNIRWLSSMAGLPPTGEWTPGPPPAILTASVVSSLWRWRRSPGRLVNPLQAWASPFRWRLCSTAPIGGWSRDPRSCGPSTRPRSAICDGFPMWRYACSGFQEGAHLQKVTSHIRASSLVSVSAASKEPQRGPASERRLTALAGRRQPGETQLRHPSLDLTPSISPRRPYGWRARGLLLDTTSIWPWFHGHNGWGLQDSRWFTLRQAPRRGRPGAVGRAPGRSPPSAVSDRRTWSVHGRWPHRGRPRATNPPV